MHSTSSLIFRTHKMTGHPVQMHVTTMVFRGLYEKYSPVTVRRHELRVIAAIRHMSAQM